jgi:glutamyl-tRNA reductase
MQIYMTGLNHDTADVELRGRVSFREKEIPQQLRMLCGKEAVESAVILSTCNRMEIYVTTNDVDSCRIDVAEFIAESRGVGQTQLAAHLYEHVGSDAVNHLFRVVSSLDSMVLGEQQIIGQTRTAFKLSLEAGYASMMLSRLFRQALETGKRVRSETSISANHVSVSTVAIDVARETFDTLDDKKVLVVGSGEMSELAARYLQEQGVEAFFVSSRTYTHACKLADQLGGQAFGFDKLGELIRDADIVVTATAAPHAVITPEITAPVAKQQLILDIALPRDTDPACADNPNIKLVDLDGLEAIIAKNRDARKHAAEQASAIVDEETELFERWVDEHAVTPTIKEMRSHAEAVREHEVEHLMRVMDTTLSEKDRQAIEKATSAIVNKLLHEPTVRMKGSVDRGNDFECVEAARFLFGLADGPVEHSHALANETLSTAR